MKKLIILQTVTPDYRSKLFSYIYEVLGNSFKLYGGDFYFEKSVESDKSLIIRTPIKNNYFFNRKFLFQTGMWNIITKKNIMVLELNPRIISNWIILIIRKILFKKTILWGHAWPRKGKNSKTDWLRNIMRVLSDEIIVYTNSQRVELQGKMKSKIIKTAPNSLFYKYEMEIGLRKGLINNIIYVGRLTKTKKALFLTKSFHKTLPKLSPKVNLIIVGEGEEKIEIENYIKEHKLTDRVKIKGHVNDYNKLKEMYNDSLLSVSPGYVGLSVTQSFGFGVPMLISREEPHSPEIEAVMEFENSLYFETDNINSLTAQIIDFYKNKDFWISKREQICIFCKKNYSIEKMAEVFIQYENLEH